MITLVNLKIDLGIVGTDQDAKLQRLIDRATKMIQKYCGREFNAIARTEVFKGTGTQYLNLKEHPIISVTKTEVNVGSSEEPVWEEITCYVKKETGQLYIHSGFFRAENRYRVSYVGGYEPIPYDLEGACSDLVAFMLADQGKKGLISERIGEYSYTKSPITNVIEQSGIREVLDAYRTINA